MKTYISKGSSNLHTFLICLDLCIFCVILLPKRCCGAHYQYEACEPKNCSRGPNIRFPFHISRLQADYCGYPGPGFNLTCGGHGFPLLQLTENNYVVDDIFYGNQSLHVYAAAVLESSDSNCVPRISNTTISGAQFNYVNSTDLYLFSGCRRPFPEALLRYNVSCGNISSSNWDLALYGEDGNLRKALEICPRNVVASVELDYRDEGSIGIAKVNEVLRRGFVLNWTASNCSRCEESGGRCGFEPVSFHFRCFCPDRPHMVSCKPEKNLKTHIIAIAVPVSAVFVGICLIVSIILYRCKKRNNNSYLLSRNISSDPSSKSDIEVGSFYFGAPIFSYEELVKATNNFDPSQELGDGGFGTVYYGKLQDGREVAIKRLYEHNCRRVEQFSNEIKILTCLRHPNLVSLYGCTSRRSRELLLVYEYISNGTVADHLHGERAKEAPLTWLVRISIAIETANALAYLHKSDIIHRDVKTNNILLDSSFCVKVADFGLSRLFPNDVTHVSTAPQGTPGYVDPEYHQCYQLTDKSDVYSFGVVLIELISSMPAVDISRHRHEINLANLAVNRIQQCAFDELIDPSLGYNSDTEVTRMTTSVAELAFRCLQVEKDLRPSMDEVLAFLMDIRDGGDCKFEKVDGVNGYYGVHGKRIPPSPETDDAVLLKNKNFQSSPVAVTDTWISSSSTTTSSIG